MCANTSDPWPLLTTIKLRYTWRFEGNKTFATQLQAHPNFGAYIESPRFCDDENEDIKWRLLLYPKGLNREVTGCMSLFAICESTNYTFISVPPKIKFTLGNCSIPSHSEKTSDGKLCVSRDKSNNDNCWGFPKFIKADILTQYHNSISQHSTHACSCNISCEIDSLGFVSPCTNYQFNYNIGKLFETHKFSDFKLNVNNEIFHVHKAILAASSPVFEAMFEHDMMEKTEGIVDIVDVESEVFKEMLRYMYTGKKPNFKKTDVFGLIAAADRYQLDELKIMCAIYLWNNLTTDNVSEILILADVHCSTELKKRAIDFINTHANLVIATDAYKMLCKSHQHLVVECYQALVTLTFRVCNDSAV